MVGLFSEQKFWVAAVGAVGVGLKLTDIAEVLLIQPFRES
jgi:hypothetical protein